MPLTINNERENRPVKRIRVLHLIFAGVYILYAIRLFSMQIISGELYKTKAQNIARRTTEIPAQRGEIYDRNFNLPMVLNIDSFAVQITPGEIPRNQIPSVFTRLSNLLNIPKEQIDQKVPPAFYSHFQPIEIVANVSFETITSLAERIDELPGISWKSKPIRNYVETGSLSHIIGYVGDITREELKIMYNKGYEFGDVIGKAGVERQYDDLLRGKSGSEIRTVDARGKKVVDGEGNSQIAPEMGKNLVLTIDRNIQTLAEKALGERMGAIVVLKPNTGEVLAMVSYPWYDPNIFNKTQTGNSSQFQNLINDVNRPFLNRAIQSNYPPASTFKIIMSSAILNEKAFPPEKTIKCDGEISYGDRVFRCWIRRPGHGPLNLQGALAQSCDIYFWVVGRDNLGIERIVSYAKDFGLGTPTGIDLPGEISGFVPTPQWKERRFHEKWLHGDTMNASIGQGYTLITPLQMADQIAMVVNGGTIYQPHILKEIRDPASGAIVKKIQPQILHKSDIPADVFSTVRDNMRAVVTEGTARYPNNIKPVEVAGKTGTAEVGLADRWHAWFVAFAPYKTSNPDEQIVVSVIVEASNPWEWWASYAAAILMQGIFGKQDYDEAVRTLGLNHLTTPKERRE